MLSGAVSGFGAGFGLWMGIAWGAMAGAGSSALMGGNPAIGAGIGAFSAALGYGAMKLANGNLLKQIVGSAAVGGISGGLSSEAYGGEFGEGAGYGAGYAVAGAVASAGVKYASNGFKTDAEVQATQRKIANLQAMLDEAYAEGGTAKQVKISVEIVSVTTSPSGQSLITPSRILGGVANIAAAAGNSKAALALKTTGNILNPAGPGRLLVGLVGGKAGFQIGGQLGAKIGFEIGLVCGGNFLPGTIIGYGIGAVAGGIMGAYWGSQIGSKFDSPDSEVLY